MNREHIDITKRRYIRPEVTKVAVDTSLVLMQPSLPGHHHTNTSGSKSPSGMDEPSFQSPFGDKPFS